jgi:outer membrane protein assembly factor BamB
MKPIRWLAALLAMLVADGVTLADWPQWRGANRDAKVSDFHAPSTWPAELTKKWSVPVGDGAATPALVGDKLYVFSREGDGETLRCLDANTGNEIWKQSYEAQPSTDPGGFRGPRSSPTVAEGKVVVESARGALHCFDAATGKPLWNKDEFKSWPRFFASSSPIIVDGLVIAQLGGVSGAVVAYDVNTGAEKWKVGDLPTAYASPVLMNVAGTKLVIATVENGIVAIDVASGKNVWEKFFERGGSRYKAATPIVNGDTLIYFDGAATAVKLEKDGDKFADKPLWTYNENRVEFNTPVLKNGLLIGLTGPSGSGAHQFFVLDTSDNKTTWTSAAPRIAAAGPPGAPPPDAKGEKRGFGDKAGEKGDKGFGGKGPPGGFGGKGGGMGGGMRADPGYGSVVDAGSVILTLTPNAELIVFQPSGKELKQIASYKLGQPGAYAYPVASGNRIYIKDKDNITLWTVN